MQFELTDRDRAVVQAVSMLSQVSTSHIKQLLFPNVSYVSLYRSLRRLKDQKLIRKVGVRAVAYKGGTAPGVYTLGPRGWNYVRRGGKYPGVGGVQEHTLNIADIYVGLKEHEQAGAIRLLDDTGLEYSLDGLRADLYLDIAIPSIRKRRRFFVEVQRNARKEIINQKIEAHWNASLASGGRWPVVAFVSPDEWIVSEIKRLIPTERRGLFRAFTTTDFLAECVSTDVREAVVVGD